MVIGLVAVIGKVVILARLEQAYFVVIPQCANMGLAEAAEITNTDHDYVFHAQGRIG